MQTQVRSGVSLWLRDESKPFEQRAALTPNYARKLIEHGIRVTVESSESRCFLDADYQRAGCSLAQSGSWRSAPSSAIILGLKELPDEQTPLTHHHIYFAHAFKKQKGSLELLTRFKNGDGTLWDLEYLMDDQGRRIAAFGRWAGFVGAGVALGIWADQRTQNFVGEPLKAYPMESLFTESILKKYSLALESNKGYSPKILIIGALGRCGKGASDFFKKVGLEKNLTLWDQEQTKTGGPFNEVLQFDIFVNTVLLQGSIAPFLNHAMIDQPRMLSVISDVSCDPTSPFNPIPIYSQCTTFQKPVLNLKNSPRLDLLAVDHLPSVLPRESSEDFCSQLFPQLLKLKEGSPVWERADVVFRSQIDNLSRNSGN